MLIKLDRQCSSSFSTLPYAFPKVLFAALLAVSAACSGAQEPKHPDSNPLMTELNRAMSMAENGQTSQALSLASTLVEEHPESVPALKLQGALLERVGRVSEAEQAYVKALKASPGDPGLLFKLASFRLAAGDNDQAVTV